MIIVLVWGGNVATNKLSNVDIVDYVLFRPRVLMAYPVLSFFQAF